MLGPLSEEEQDGRLGEALDPGPHLPTGRAGTAPAAGSSSTSHAVSICVLHVLVDRTVDEAATRRTNEAWGRPTSGHLRTESQVTSLIHNSMDITSNDRISLYEQLARIGKVVVHPKRIELLDLLCQAERSVETLATATGLKLTTASAHLQVMRQARLVETRREGTRVYYRSAGEEVCRFVGALNDLARAAPRRGRPDPPLARYRRGGHAAGYPGRAPGTRPEPRGRRARREAGGGVHGRPHPGRTLAPPGAPRSPSRRARPRPRDRRLLPRAVVPPRPRSGRLPSCPGT